MQTKSGNVRYWQGLKLEDALERDFRYAQGMYDKWDRAPLRDAPLRLPACQAPNRLAPQPQEVALFV